MARQKTNRKWLVLLITFLFTACGEQELSFGKEVFYSVKEAENMDFSMASEHLLQVAVGENRMWALTTNGDDCLYEWEIDTGTVQSLTWEQGENEFVMGISAVGDTLYSGVSCAETVQVRKSSGEGQWETVLVIPWEEAPEQISPTLFFVDSAENTYFANGTKIRKYSPANGQQTVLELKEPAAFLQEKEPGEVEAVTKSSQEISLYPLQEGEKPKKKWTVKLPTSHLSTIQTDNPDILALAVDNKILFVNNTTGEIISHFDSIAAGVSTNLLGGIGLMEEGFLYLAEQVADSGGIWEKLIAQTGPEGDRTVLVYGTVSLSEAMKERVVSFNKSNPDYYITIKEYEGNTISDRRLQLQAALASGNAPDIVDLYTRNVENYRSYAEKGYLEDLEPYLLQEEFSDDILWSVQNLYRVKGNSDSAIIEDLEQQESYRMEGKLYMVVPHFTICGLTLHPDYAVEPEKWNFQTFSEAAGHLQGEQRIVTGGTAGSILAEILFGMQGEFVDYEEKKAYFDTEEFRDLLELCKNCGKKSLVKSGSSYDTLEYVDQVMMMSLSLHGPSSYMSLHAYYGENAGFYGFPTRDGQVFLVDNADDACSIYAGSKHKEGAWEFLKTLFAEDYQRKMTGYGSFWAVRESGWYEMWEPYRSESIVINGVNVGSPTEEEIASVMDILKNGNLTANLMPYNMTSLILEEADAYFEGGRSVAEAAGNIQNRVQLLIEE